MPSPPRTREFYRPLLEDLHEAAREWRAGLSRLQLYELLVVVGVLTVGPLVVFCLVQYATLAKPEDPYIWQPVTQGATPAGETLPATVSMSVVNSFKERGATFGPPVYGWVTSVTLEGNAFTDDDMPVLSTLVSLESVTLIDVDITDDGLRDLQLPRLSELDLINTQVTDEGAEAYAETNGPANVRVRLIREFGDD